MNIFDRVESQGFMLMEAFADFRRLVAEMQGKEYRPGGDSGIEAPGYENERYPQVEEEESDPFLSLLAQEDASYEEEDGVCYPDFPEEMSYGAPEYAPNTGWQAFQGRKAFRMEDIDAEDPAYWRGKEIGIPINLAVRISPEQGMQLPVAGMRGPRVRGY